MSGIAGKVVALTGASSGIGEATARLLAARGAAVVLGARRTDRLDALAAEIRAEGGRALALPSDVTVPGDQEAMVARAVEEYGRLDVLVANAGVATVGPVAELDLAAWTAMVDVNLRGVLHGVAAALPVFRAQGEGHVVATVSTSGLKIVPGQAVYAATKNAVRTFMEALRQESTDGTLRTTTISPGFVRTELSNPPGAAENPHAAMLPFALAPEAVARAIAFAVEQPQDVEIGAITLRPTVQG
ncbi:SDR family oxidoreductase [Streptomyces sp. SID11385]|uniref:SDR family oxidoreductase n=1 Tax=Streptomyces sp. SID11385 TaxID=2706031 RepID=UPI0013CB85D3|nr:SDR family oxidoreductase [Streptomyces sp. SID11385]NEA38643.1 SDR family oxidoreductase [Streptomyces sp. SID11385]